MELRHLRYFVAVSESLHFGQAATALDIAQPSLSHQIRQLETELQTTLLRRTRRRVELTEAGRLFLSAAREILARTDRAALIARRAGRGETGRLRVGIGHCMDQSAVGTAVSLFNQEHKTTRVELRTMAVPAQFEAIQNERLDVGFVRPMAAGPGLRSDILVSEPLVVALPKAHRLARKQSVRLSAFTDDAFVLVSPEAVPVYHDIVLKACREAGFVPNAPQEADHLQLVLGMVAAGSGVALVPEFARTLEPARVVFASLRPPRPTLETALLWRRDNTSPVLREFVETVRHVLMRERNVVEQTV